MSVEFVCGVDTEERLPDLLWADSTSYQVGSLE